MQNLAPLLFIDQFNLISSLGFNQCKVVLYWGILVSNLTSAIVLLNLQMPVFSKLTEDIKGIMSSFVDNFKEPMYAVRETAVHSGEPLLGRMGHTIGKIMGGHFGEKRFCQDSSRVLNLGHL